MSKTEQVYRVWFDDPQGNRRFVDMPRENGIDYFRSGFWVTADFDIGSFTNPLGSHWIPPSRMVIATKLDTTDD